VEVRFFSSAPQLRGEGMKDKG